MGKNQNLLNIDKMGFRALLHLMMTRRWWATLVVLLTFLAIILGIGLAIMNKSEMAEQWKEILLLMLGAFIGSYGKIIDYWFTDTGKDKLFAQKMDEEDGITLSKIKDDAVEEAMEKMKEHLDNNGGGDNNIEEEGKPDIKEETKEEDEEGGDPTT